MTLINSRRIRNGHVGTGEINNTYKISVGKTEGKKQLGRPRSRWDNNTKWILKKLDRKVWAGFIWHRTNNQWRAFENTASMGGS
jgi:hypothetical protein